jgi:7-keto-8-aminopelargonate synthetase-like enzyme
MIPSTAAAFWCQRWGLNPLLSAEDAIISDSLNHSIIDGVRLWQLKDIAMRIA